MLRVIRRRVCSCNFFGLRPKTPLRLLRHPNSTFLFSSWNIFDDQSNNPTLFVNPYFHYQKCMIVTQFLKIYKILIAIFLHSLRLKSFDTRLYGMIFLRGNNYFEALFRYIIYMILHSLGTNCNLRIVLAYHMKSSNMNLQRNVFESYSCQKLERQTMI